MRNMQGVQTIECSFISSLLVDVTTPPVMLFCDAIITRLVTSLTSSATNSTSGVIVYGPSGTGKSSLVENIAHGCRKTHRVLQVSCAELIHKVVGESEKKLTEIFAAGDLLSIHSPLSLNYFNSAPNCSVAIDPGQH